MVIPPAVDVGRTTPRRDVSDVPLQDGDIAKRCPLAVQYRTVPPSGEGGFSGGDETPGARSAATPSAIDRLREEKRLAHHRSVQEQLIGLIQATTVIEIESLNPSGAIEQTKVAMLSGARVVVDAVLPTDAVGRRLGRSMVLVRADCRADGRWAYHPIEIRNHRTLDSNNDSAQGQGYPGYQAPAGALIAELAEPAWDSAVLDPKRRNRSHAGDLLWLAHSHRLLQAAGHDSETAAGGVVGPEDLVVWHRLDQPVMQHRWDLPAPTYETMLERYDREFSFRLDVLAAALEGDPIVGPVAVGECARCRWWERCRPEIEAEDSSSLLPGFGYRQWFNLARSGITTRAHVAALHLPTAVLRDALPGAVDLAQIVASARSVPAETAIEDVVGLALNSTDISCAGAAAEGDDGDEDAQLARQIVAACSRHGVHRSADLALLDPSVVALAGQPVARLADAIQHARAQASGRPQLRHGVAELLVPGADVEIDIDMESALDGTAYLWGALADGRYNASVSWDQPSPEVAARVFCEFWDWLEDRRRRARQDGQTVALYCWFRGAESRALRAGAKAAAAHAGRPDAPALVEALLAGPEFVDLYEVFTTQLVTGGSAGLKTIATAAGFVWRDQDPNGAESMAWHADAVVMGSSEVGEDADQARSRLLAYNEDDVRATASVRSWMRTALTGVTTSVQATSRAD